MTPALSIIDTLGPFFVENPDRRDINWSKVIFADLENGDRLDMATRRKIIENFDIYVQRVAQLGYNSVSVDDLAHLVSFTFYDQNLQVLLRDYHGLYKKLFAIAKRHNMKIFVNTDYLFFNQSISDHLAETSTSPDDFYTTVLTTALRDFPEIDGVILRVGETDGTDVSGHFLSQLLLHTPQQAHRLIRKILPLFEHTGKKLIFRTWTVGAYKIGDLLWNEKTYDTVFSSITSDALIISMKYGDTDFMRHLKLNPLFMNSPHKKIVELQTRREWEGMGTFPSFVGWDYAKYLQELSDNPSVIGIHTWCQTGGWAKKAWTNLTFLPTSSFWNELNTEVTIHIAHGMSPEDAVVAFCQQRSITDTAAFIELLRQSDHAVKKGLYVHELAQKEFYFRRTRIPPLMWMTWDRVHLPAAVVHLHRILISRPERFITDGDEAVQAVEKMISIAHDLHLPKTVIDSLNFERATMTILAELRRYIIQPLDTQQLNILNQQITDYQNAYPQHYSIPKLHAIQKKRIPRSLLSPFMRESSSYRKRDKIFLKTSPVQARMVRYYLRKSRSHLADQSMGLETLFK